MRKPINLIAGWGLPSNWQANRKNRIYLKWKQLTREGAGENNQNAGHEGKHGLEHRTALKLETKVTHNITEGPGQTGRNTRSVTQIHPKKLLIVHFVNPFNECESLNQILPKSPFTKMKEIKHLKSILVTPISYTWDQSGCPSLNLFQHLNIFLIVRFPELHTVLQVWSN